MVIIVTTIEQKLEDRKINFSSRQYIADKIGKTNVSAIIGSHRISKIAPTKAKL